MTAMEILKQCQTLLEDYKKLCEDLEEKRSAAYGLTAYKISCPVQRSEHSDHTSAAAIQIQEAEHKKIDKLTQLTETRQTALDLIHGLDLRLQAVIIDRYILGKTAREISAASGLCDRQVYRLLKEAREQLSHELI